jgi:4-amino-4-deoxy-L-arabinose transferase-like glycosyltransferase
VSEASRGDPLSWGLPLATLLAHLATAKGYGYFRDELYYLACSEHLGLGYVDHPPLVAWITAASRAVLGDSLPAIRFVPAVCAGVAVLLAMSIAREMGGGRFARVLAGLAVMLAPIYLSLFGILSMNCIDVALWAAVCLVTVKALRGENPSA